MCVSVLFPKKMRNCRYCMTSHKWCIYSKSVFLFSSCAKKFLHCVRFVILVSVLGDSSVNSVLYKIMKSKHNIYNLFFHVGTMYFPGVKANSNYIEISYSQQASKCTSKNTCKVINFCKLASTQVILFQVKQFNQSW